MKGKKYLAIILIFLITISFASSALENIEGTIWINDEHNWSLEFKTNPENEISNIKMEEEALYLGNTSISIKKETNTRTEVKLYRYKILRNENDLTSLKLGFIHQSDQAAIEIGNLSGRSNRKYTLSSENLNRNLSKGEKIQWNIPEGESNFTLKSIEDDTSSSNQEITDSEEENSIETDRKVQKIQLKDLNSDLIRNINVWLDSNISDLNLQFYESKNESIPGKEEFTEIYYVQPEINENEIENVTISLNSETKNDTGETQLYQFKEEWKNLENRITQTSGSETVYQIEDFGYIGLKTGSSDTEKEEKITPGKILLAVFILLASLMTYIISKIAYVYLKEE